MEKENPIVCANGHHEDIILNFLAGIQNIIDEASVKQEDLPKVLKKLHKRLRRTHGEIEIMILIYPHLEMDETYLN
jgi:hypothetical protein